MSASLFEGIRGETDFPAGYRDYTASVDIESRMEFSPFVPRSEQGGRILDANVSLSALHLSVVRTRHTELLGESFDFSEPSAEILTAPIRGDARDTRIEAVNDGPRPSSWVSAS